MSHESQADKLWRQMEIRMSKKEEGKVENEKGIRISLNRLRWLSVAASILLVICISFAGYMTKQLYDINTVVQTYTALNGKSKIVLPDGSDVWLNAESSLEYRTTFWSKERSVLLNGEAFFNVAKDKDHPFVVKSQGFRVKVYGTTFNVEAREKSNEMCVSLLSGSVDVASANEAHMIMPGETAVCMKNSGKISVEKSDVDFVAMWAKESVRFERKSIRELIKYLSRWYGVKIYLDPSIPENQAYTFTIKNEPLEEILRLMARIHPIKYSFDENNKVTISENN